MKTDSTEDQIIALQSKPCASCTRRADKIRALRAALRCTHKYTESFRWEHDNGYGRQKMLNALRCTICHMVQRWDGGSWSSE